MSTKAAETIKLSKQPKEVFSKRYLSKELDILKTPVCCLVIGMAVIKLIFFLNKYIYIFYTFNLFYLN